MLTKMKVRCDEYFHAVGSKRLYRICVGRGLLTKGGAISRPRCRTSSASYRVPKSWSDPLDPVSSDFEVHLLGCPVSARYFRPVSWFLGFVRVVGESKLDESL